MKVVLFILVLLPCISLGQITLSGNLVSNSEAVSYANVLLSELNGKFISGTISDENGAYKIEAALGDYTLSVRHINYLDYDRAVKLESSIVMDQINLIANSQEIDEITVTAKKPTIRREIDKTVFNIENSLLAKSGSSFEALQSAPGLVVRNEALTMLGKSFVRVSIDGRLLEMEGNELNAYLRSIPASDIKEIEIISNPSARYEAEGNSGIVNIVTKHVRQNSWNNALSVRNSQAKYGWQNYSNNFSYKKNQLSLLVSASGQTGSRYFLQYVEPEYSENPQKITSHQNNNRRSISPRIMLDYKKNENTTLGIQFMGSRSRSHTRDDLQIDIFNKAYVLEQVLVANGAIFKGNNANSSYNFYFDRILDSTGRRFTFNFDVLYYRRLSTTDIVSNLHDSQYNFIRKEFANSGKASSNILNYSAKIDLENPMSWLNLSYGAKSSYSTTKYQIENYNTITGDAVLNPLQSNQFDFTEAIHSAYVSGNKGLGDQFEIQFGLRAEYTDTKGNSDQTEINGGNYSNEYLNIFPTLFFKYNKDENHVFTANYGKRINRPAFSQLNPAKTFLSSQSSQQGNPYLLPSLAHNIEFSHTYKSNLSTTLSFRRTLDAYSFIFDLDDETQMQRITHRNLYNENSAAIMSSYNMDFTSWWHSRVLLFYGQSLADKLNPEENITLFSKGEFYGSCNNSLNLNSAKSVKAEVNFWYSSPFASNIYSFGESYSLDFALSFTSIVKGMNLTLGAYDVFNSAPRTINSEINQVNHNFIAYPSSRYFRASLSYSFGNKDITTRERRFGNEDIQNRSN